jgi:hypothetical protein
VIAVKKDASGQPVTEYYVGTSVGLYSTENLGVVLMANSSPVWMREGGSVLNYPIVQSMAYRPSDNVLLIGTHGNGMYYTQVGTPNFQPNSVTSIAPVINDPSFIRSIYPTLGYGKVHFRKGTLTGVSKMSIQVFTTTGQMIFTSLMPYADGNIPLSRPGMYFMILTSGDRKYRHVQKIIRQ